MPTQARPDFTENKRNRYRLFFLLRRYFPGNNLFEKYQVVTGFAFYRHLDSEMEILSSTSTNKDEKALSNLFN